MHLIATFVEVNLEPMQRMFALLCSLDSTAVFTELANAALMFLYLFAAIDMPIPVPQIKIPIFFELIFLQSFSAKSG